MLSQLEKDRSSAEDIFFILTKISWSSVTVILALILGGALRMNYFPPFIEYTLGIARHAFLIPRVCVVNI